jgi:hypothetical protein
VINYLAFGSTLSVTQWVGLVGLSATILTMGVVGRRQRGASQLGIETGQLVPATAAS